MYILITYNSGNYFIDLGDKLIEGNIDFKIYIEANLKQAYTKSSEGVGAFLFYIHKLLRKLFNQILRLDFNASIYQSFVKIRNFIQSTIQQL